MRNQLTQRQQLLQKEFEKKLKLQQTQELLFGPENEILKKKSDLFLDRLFLEMQLRDGKSKIADVIMLEPREYEAVFHRDRKSVV